MDIFTNEKCYIIPVEFGTPEYDQTIALRDEILRKPLGLDFTAEQLSTEYEDFHLACYNHQDKLLGCLVLSHIDDKTIKMRQVAVQTELQKKGIGSFLVEASEVFSKQKGYEEMVMNARDTAVPFYTRLKYKKQGKPFTEVTIKHYKMSKKLDA